MDLVLTWKPEVESNFVGVIQLKPLNYIEKMTALKKLNVKVSSEGSVDLDNFSQFDSIIEMYKLVEPRVVYFSLAHKVLGEIKDLEHLGMMEEGSAVIPALGAMLFKGISLGKS